ANQSDRLCYGIGHLLVDRLIPAHDLNVVRSWQSKVNRLTYDIGCQEIQRDTWEVAIQTKPQVSYIIRRRLMPGSQCHQDVGIGRRRNAGDVGKTKAGDTITARVFRSTGGCYAVQTTLLASGRESARGCRKL